MTNPLSSAVMGTWQARIGIIQIRRLSRAIKGATARTKKMASSETLAIRLARSSKKSQRRRTQQQHLLMPVRWISAAALMHHRTQESPLERQMQHRMSQQLQRSTPRRTESLRLTRMSTRGSGSCLVLGSTETSRGFLTSSWTGKTRPVNRTH